MVLISISFLLGFRPFPTKRKLSRATLRASTSKASNFKKKGSRLLRRTPSVDRMRSPLTYEHEGLIYVHPSVKNVRSCHISYLLSPEHMIHVSVVLMEGNIAKVCTKDEVVALKAIVLDDRVSWVAFSITHELKSPKYFLEILKWHRHNVDFTVSENPIDLLPKAHTEDVYCIKTNVDSPATADIAFVEVGIVAALRFSSIKEDADRQNASEKLRTRRTAETIFSKLLAQPNHKESITNEILNATKAANALDQTEKEKSKDEKEDNEEEKKKNRRQKRKSIAKRKRSKSEGHEKCVMVISGQKLLYDKRTWTSSRSHISSRLELVQLWLTSTNFITEEMRKENIPFAVYLRNLVNFPDNDINGPRHLRLKFSLGDLIQNIIVSVSKGRNSSNKIPIDDVKMFFLGQVPLLKILQVLQTQKLVIEILELKNSAAKNETGFLDTPSWKKSSNRTKHYTFNDERMKINYLDAHETHIHQKLGKSKTHKPANPGGENTTVPQLQGAADVKSDGKFHLVGYAEVDCSALAHDGYRVDNNANIYQYNSQEHIKSSRALQHFSPFIAHENVHHQHKGEMENGLLVQESAFLQVSVQLCGLPELSSPDRIFHDLYKRIVIIFCERKTMAAVLNRLLLLNSKVLSLEHLEIPWVPYWLPRKIIPSDLDLMAEHPCLLTGFVVEFTGKKSLMMVEGLNDYTFREVLKAMFKLPTAYGKVLYDDRIIFTERLYEEFVPMGGFHLTLLKSSIEKILRDKMNILRNGVPAPAQRALVKIQRLLSSRNMQAIAMEKLFPNAQDLTSFNIEFGDPEFDTLKRGNLQH